MRRYREGFGFLLAGFLFILLLLVFGLPSCKPAHPSLGYQKYTMHNLVMENGYATARIDSCVFYFLGQGNALSAIHSWQCDYSKCPNIGLYRLHIRSPGRKVGYYKPPFNDTTGGDRANSHSDKKPVEEWIRFPQLYFIDPKKQLAKLQPQPYRILIFQHFQKGFTPHEKIYR